MPRPLPYPYLLIATFFLVNGLVAQPVINSFSPSSGPIGTTVTITGTNFDPSPANNTVWFGTVKAAVSATTSNTLTVTVPVGTSYRPITVTTNHFTAWSAQPFIVTFPGGDTAFTPTSFNRNIDLPAGSLPINLTNFDLNGDSKPDIVTANYSGSTLSIYRNKSTPGAMSFGQQQTLALSGKPTSVDVGDLDGDGRPDIVASGELTTIAVFRNTTTGDTITFAPEQHYDAPNYAQGIAIGDLDGDGKPEIAVTSNQSNLVSIYRNTSTPGAISFASPISLPTGNAPQSVAIGDLNGDGKAELVVTDYYGPAVSVYRNTSTSGNISFDPKSDFPTGTQPYHIAIGDLDGDGSPDLLTGNANAGTVSVLRNSSAAGTIAFDAKVDLPTGTTPYGIAIGDLNGDGKPDIAESNYSVSPSMISVLKNLSTPGTISFSPRVDYATGNSPYCVTIGDFDGDGQPDMATANFGGNTVSVIPNEVGHAVRAAIPAIYYFTPTWGPIGTTVYIKGVNFDTIASNNIVYFGAVKAVVIIATDTLLTVTVPVGTTYQPLNVTVRNLTVYAQQAFYVTFPGGSAAFGSVSFDSIPYDLSSNNPRRVVIADFDGDGKTDLLVSDQGSTTVTAYKNLSVPQIMHFAPGISLTSGNGPSDITTADFDGDGKPDAAVSNSNSGNDGSVSLFRNTSTGSNLNFAPAITLPTGAGTVGLAAGDLDGDGRPDLVACSGNSGYLSFFLNTSTTPGTISFGAKQDITQFGHADNVAIGDVDGDGKADLVTANFSDGSVSLWVNTSSIGQLFFQRLPAYGAGVQPTHVILTDLNGDGKPEILTANYGDNTISVLKNTSTVGAPSFDAKVDYPTLKNPYSISVGDLDGDGRPDLVVPSDIPPSFGLYKNTSDSSTISFAPRVDDSTGYGPTYVGIGDLDGDGKPDLAVANHYDRVSILRNTTGEPTVVASGTHPVQGNINTEFYLDSTVQTANNSPYVQRHYDIEPANDPATATATVTLYFEQQDFDSFNAFPSHGPSLPTGPTDTAGIANLRIYQYHGTSASHLPDTYGGSAVIIDPADNDITFDAVAKRWKVRFNVTGFSGFFASSKGSTLPTGTNDTAVNGNNQLKLYPNPATDDHVLAQHPSSQAAQLQLTDITGKVIKTINVSPNTTQTLVYLKGLASGVYNLTWLSKNKRLTQSFLIRRQ